MLIELRGLRLAGVQRQMRAEVLRAGHTLASAAPDVPLEWRQWRRPPADPWGLGAAVAAAAAAGAPQHDPAELARQEDALPLNIEECLVVISRGVDVLLPHLMSTKCADMI